MNARHLFLATLWLAGFPAGRAVTAQPPHKQAPPKTMCWSWFADDDFRPLADRGIGVAYLALSVQLDGRSTVTPSPRGIPVRIPPKMYTMAVVRFDNPLEGAERPAYSVRQRELAVRMIAEIAAFAHPQAVQFDFDAPQSAWPFYRQLLSDVRARLSPEIFLSVTALVSWCDSEQSWMAKLPVDEIVPMAFYMGQATPAVVTKLQRGGTFAFAGCRGTLGVTVGDEYGRPSARPRKEQRAYFFPGSNKWSPELLEEAQRAFQQ